MSTFALSTLTGRSSLVESVNLMVGEKVANGAAVSDERVKSLDDRLSRELADLAKFLRSDIEALQARELSAPAAPTPAPTPASDSEPASVSAPAAVVDTEARKEVDQLRADAKRHELQRTADQVSWNEWIARIDALVAQLRSDLNGLRDDARWQKLERLETQQSAHDERLERAGGALADTNRAVSELSAALTAAKAESEAHANREEELLAEEAKRDAAIEALLLAFRQNLTEQLDSIRVLGDAVNARSMCDLLSNAVLNLCFF